MGTLNASTTPARELLRVTKPRGDACVTITASVIRLNGVRVSHQEMVVLRKIAARLKGEAAFPILPPQNPEDA
ncbi:hypothetical protein QZM35_17435 [Burkholderia sp. AU45274]|uniref:hypothetical protein n=1 Tax=Burkholderia sp. AU45274 TaxID=3059205 RepID=UPI00264E032E|nr:hypothetical protein [Burkholderia sp. AU45274]MDN7489493.1 hypothetical protein [Burkholderia sp. AU45274]